MVLTRNYLKTQERDICIEKSNRVSIHISVYWYTSQGNTSPSYAEEFQGVNTMQIKKGTRIYLKRLMS